MRQRGLGRDKELTIRMTFTMFMLALVFVAFLGLLFWAGIHPIFILVVALVMVVFQYFSSDKIVLMTTGAKEVTPQEEPRLHAMVERLAAMADMPKPKKDCGHGYPRSQRLCDGPQSQERRGCRHKRASGPTGREGARGRAGP